MSVSYTPDFPGTPGGLNVEVNRMLPKSSPRFGALSHHSFFSRHNPHPHRVRHIQGLNGRPVCSVRDDWYVTSSLFPHPLLKSHVLKRGTDPSSTLPLAQSLYGATGYQNRSTFFSEAWKDELKELAAKINLASQAQKDKKENQPDDEIIRRKTQYSAQTGRIIPPSSKSHQRRSHSQRLVYPQPLHDQELMVLEVLCQILQTDSLSTVQQWLLLAGQREKDLVMGMIKQALDGVDVHQQNTEPPPLYAPSLDQSWRKPWRTSASRMCSTFGEDKPERIGDAEVLQVHDDDDAQPTEKVQTPCVSPNP